MKQILSILVILTLFLALPGLANAATTTYQAGDPVRYGNNFLMWQITLPDTVAVNDSVILTDIMPDNAAWPPSSGNLAMEVQVWSNAPDSAAVAIHASLDGSTYETVLALPSAGAANVTDDTQVLESSVTLYGKFIQVTWKRVGTALSAGKKLYVTIKEKGTGVY